MIGSDNLYSQFVTWSKILLPLAGLALLSTLFLWARGEEQMAVPFAELEELAREPRINAPNFAGITDDGSVISLQATDIRPDPEQPDAFAVQTIRAEIDATDGSRIEITAGEGAIDPRARKATLSGLARLTSSSGYVMETSGLVADLQSGSITSLGPLEVQAPFGDFTAGGLTIALSDSGEGHQMVFNGGVRLLYQPQ